jgi:hypothetical protein
VERILRAQDKTSTVTKEGLVALRTSLSAATKKGLGFVRPSTRNRDF